MITHQVLLRGAAQCYLLQTAMRLVDVVSVPVGTASQVTEVAWCAGFVSSCGGVRLCWAVAGRLRLRVVSFCEARAESAPRTSLALRL